MPDAVVNSAPVPVRVRKQADGEIGAGTAIVDRIRLQRVHASGPRLERGDVLAPGDDGIVLVQPHAKRDVPPQPLDVGLSVDLLGPSEVRAGNDAPVDGSIGVLL